MPRPSSFSSPEIIFVGGIYLFCDAINIFLFLIGMNDFGILDFVVLPATQIYLRIKGVKATYTLIGNLIKLIPYIDVLPFFTISWIVTVIAANRAHRKGIDIEKIAKEEQGNV